MTEWEAMVAAMRADPENAALMCVCADMLDEMGEPAKAECLRWLGERGLTGEPTVVKARDGKWHVEIKHFAGYFYDAFDDLVGTTRQQIVGRGLWEAAILPDPFGTAVDERLAILAAYAAADVETRAEWVRETEELIREHEPEVGHVHA